MSSHMEDMPAHLRKEHLARAKEVTHNLHAIHQRTLDHVERPGHCQTALLGICVDVVHDALNERMAEPA